MTKSIDEIGEVAQVVQRVQESIGRERERHLSDDAWLEVLMAEMAGALCDDYGITRVEALITLREEVSLNENPVPLMEELVLRHRLAKRLGDTEEIRDALNSI